MLYSKLTVVGLLGLLAVGGIARADLNNGLVAYYPFNGDANDYSVFHNHGQLQGYKNGGPQLTDGFLGEKNSAYLFDGIDDFIRINNSSQLNPSSQLTISLWARIDGFLNEWMPLIQKGQEDESGCWATPIAAQ
jgi:hypothetical protein